MEDKYYVELKEKTLKVEIFDKVRDYAKDKIKLMLILKWENYLVKLEGNMEKI